MSETPDIEAKWTRLQASLDELADALAIRLRTIVLKVGEGADVEAIRLLEEIIEAVEVYAAPPDTEEDDD